MSKSRATPRDSTVRWTHENQQTALREGWGINENGFFTMRGCTVTIDVLMERWETKHDAMAFKAITYLGVAKLDGRIK